MSRDEQLRKFRHRWADAITQTLGTSPQAHTEWMGPSPIVGALAPFEGSGRNHVLIPTGGGMDMESVELATFEKGCIEISVSERWVWVIKPRLLEFEYIAEDPHQSFFFLHADTMTPTGVYEEVEESEHVLELSPGDYVSRDIWEQGFVDHDETGREIPIPSSARLVDRWFAGKFMVVAKGSIWNGIPATYDGRHNKMSAAQIREAIGRILSR